MGKVAKVIGTVASVAGLVVGAATGFGAVATALFIGGSVVSSIGQYLEAKKLKSKLSIGDFSTGGFLVNNRQISSVIPIVYGTCRVGGTWVWLHTSGTDNKYLYIVQTISEGPIYSIDEVYLNGELLSDTPQAGLVTWAGSVGDATNVIPTWISDQGYTDNTPYVSLLFLQLTYDKDKWASLPTITAKVRGRTLYDPRTATVGFSNNPALMVLDFLRNPRYGYGVPDEFIDFDSFSAAADWCDNNGFKFDGIISTTQKIEALETLLRHFNADLIKSHGVYKVKIHDLNNESPVMHITNDDILPGSFRFKIGSLLDKINSIQVNYTDPELNYQPNTVTVEDLESVSTEQKHTTVIDLPGANRKQAIRIANYILKRQKFNKAVSITCHQRCVALEQGDIVKVSYDDFGISEKLFRVTGKAYNENDTVSLELVEEDLSIYDFSTSTVSVTYPSTNLPDPLKPPPNVTNLSVRELGYQRQDGIWSTHIEITFMEPNYVYMDKYEIWVAENNNDFINVANIYPSDTASTIAYYYDNVKIYNTYTIKVISVNKFGVKSNGVEDSVYITGKDYAPSDIITFSGRQSGEYVVLKWDHVPDKDVIGYQIREGISWDAGTIILDRISKNTAYWKPPLEGTYRFWIKAIDAFGTFSRNAASCVVNVSDITNKINVIIEQDDFDLTPPVPGEKENLVYIQNIDALVIPCTLTDIDVTSLTDTSQELTNYDGSINLTATYTTKQIDLEKVINCTVRAAPLDISATHLSVTDLTYPHRTDITYPNDTDTHVTANISVNKYVCYSEDGITYTEQQVDGVIDCNARYIKECIKVILDTHRINFKLMSAKLVVDVQEIEHLIIEEEIPDTGKSFTLADYGVSFNYKYFVGVTCYGNYFASVTNKTLTGFTVSLYDGSGNQVSGIVDIHLRGF